MSTRTGAPLKVLHITGTGRSGSTLITGLLGSMPSVFAAGEMRYFWERAIVRGDLCGCGRPGPECPVWSGVFARLGPTVELEAARETAQQLTEALRLRRSWRWFLRRRRALDDVATGPVSDAYAAIEDATSADIIVDSSKLPTYAAMLDGLPSIELMVLHLVRDPRAAAWSWLQGRSSASDEPMGRLSPTKSSMLWTFWNGFTWWRWRKHPRYLRVRYEEFTAAPRETMQRIAAFAGVDPSLVPFVDDVHAELVNGHVIAGNPVRRSTGTIEVRSDDRWRSSMTSSDRRIVTVLTAPLRAAMGYR